MKEMLEMEEKEMDVPQEVRMKRQLGFWRTTSLLVGSVIGSGIFISPKGVLRRTGSVGLSLSVWVLAGLFNLGGALCYSELGAMLPKSGGTYTYLREGLGNFVAAGYLYQLILFNLPADLVIKCLTSAKYLITLFPTCGAPELLLKIIAGALLVTIFIFNAYSSNIAARIAIVTTVAKVTTLIVIGVGGVVMLGQGSIGELDQGFQDTTTDPTSLALALYSANFAYGGATEVSNAVEEIKNPGKTLPRSLVSGVAAVTVIYTLTNISYLTVMTRAELLATDAVAVLWGHRVLGVAASIIPVTVVISTLGAANSSLYFGSRLYFTAARDRNMPDVLSYIQVDRLTPLTALAWILALSLIYLVPADIETFINYMGFINAFFLTLVYVTFFIFRFKTMRDKPRPVKIPTVVPVVVAVVTSYLFVAPIAISPQLSYIYVAAAVGGGSAVFFLVGTHLKLHVPGYDRLVTWLQLVWRVCPPAHYHE